MQEKARLTKKHEDWCSFKKIRNQVNTKLKNEKLNWQKNKLKKFEQNSGQTGKFVKSWLTWKASGSPTQLFHDGKLINKPITLAETMNTFFI